MAQDPLNLLCVEPHFPGRLGAVADWLVRKRGYRVWFCCHQVGPRERWPTSTGRGLEVLPYSVGGVARETAVPWTRHLERGLCYAYGAYEHLEAKRPRPVDVVLGRSGGLGSTLFVPPYAAHVPIVQYFDYYYHPRRHDLADELAPVLPPDYVHWRLAANAMDLLDLENGVVPWTASEWQRGLYPREYRDDFVVIPEGIDCEPLERRPPAARAVGGRSIPDGSFVISFVASELDQLRGFDRFVSLANGLMRSGIDVVAVAVGAREVRRSLDIPHFGTDYAAKVVARDPPPEPRRLWMLGEASPSTVRELFAATDLHCYPSRPYTLSRSLLEAMAAGAPVLAWDSEPVREVIEADRTGVLCDAGDPNDGLEKALIQARDREAYAAIGDQGRERVRSVYDRDATLARLAELLDRLAKSGRA